MPQLTGSTRSATAADVLGPLLRRRVAVLRAREVEVRLDEPDAVHRFRVAARRLRSLLAAFDELFDPATCEALDVGLRQSARIVAAARDAQVVQRRLEGLLGDDPDALAVRTRITHQLETSYAKGRQEAVDHFDAPGYDSFTRMLDAFADLPPWTPSADAAAKDVFVRVLRREWMSMLRKGRRVQELDAGPVRDRRLHDVRKAAKRVKDVAEAQESISGRKVRRLGKAAARLTAVLGDYQDLVVTGLLLTTSGPDLADDDLVRRVRHREAATADELYAEFVRIFEDADRKSLRSWMS